MLSILYLQPSIKFKKKQDNIYTCEPIREFDLNGSRSRWILNINNNKQTIKIHNHHSEMFENHAEFGPRSFCLTLYHLRIRWQPLGTISILGSECNDFRNVFFIWRMNGRLGSSKIHFAGNLQKYAECIHWNMKIPFKKKSGASGVSPFYFWVSDVLIPDSNTKVTVCKDALCPK